MEYFWQVDDTDVVLIGYASWVTVPSGEKDDVINTFAHLSSNPLCSQSLLSSWLQGEGWVPVAGLVPTSIIRWPIWILNFSPQSSQLILSELDQTHFLFFTFEGLTDTSSSTNALKLPKANCQICCAKSSFLYVVSLWKPKDLYTWATYIISKDSAL